MYKSNELDLSVPRRQTASRNDTQHARSHAYTTTEHTTMSYAVCRRDTYTQ